MDPSFALSKRGRIWWATTTLPTGNKAERTTGEFSREEAEKKAAKWCDTVHRSSRAGMKGGKMHGRHRSKRKEAVSRASREADEPIARGPKPMGAKKVAPPPAPELEAESDPPEPEGDPPPPAAAGPEGIPVGSERAAEIGAKLRSLGDAPDPAYDRAPSSSSEGLPEEEYFAPGAAPTEEPGENEAGDLLADVIALGIVAGTVKGVARACKNAKPPRRAGEANEKMLEWYHAGLRHNIRRMIGNAGALGPTGKMFVGCAGVVMTMLWGSELVDPPKEAGAEPPQAAHTNGVHRDRTPAPAPAPPHPDENSTELALGRFV